MCTGHATDQTFWDLVSYLSSVEIKLSSGISATPADARKVMIATEYFWENFSVEVLQGKLII